MDFEPLLRAHDRWPASPEVRRSLEIEVRYEGYIQQQTRDAEKVRRMSARRIPPDFNYWEIEGLNREIREKLSRIRPRLVALDLLKRWMLLPSKELRLRNYCDVQELR